MVNMKIYDSQALDYCNNRKVRLLFGLIGVIFAGTVFSHFFSNYILDLNTYYVSYACWLLFFVSICCASPKIKIKNVVIFIIVMLFRVGSVICGELIYEEGLGGIIRESFFLISFLATYGITSRHKISSAVLVKLFRCIVIVGFISSLYAMITQTSYMIEVLSRHNVSWNSWLYKSFFNQRNIFAEFCYISSFATIATFSFTKEKRYLFALILFMLQIYITNSRAALLGVVALCSISFIYWKKNKWIFYLGVFFIMLGVLYASGGMDVLLVKYAHMTSSGYDSGAIRIQMWSGIIKEINDKKIWLIGAGGDSLSSFLMEKYGYGSSHNMYFDLLFLGGIPLLVLVEYLILNSYRMISRNPDIRYRRVMIAGLLSFIIYSFFEAGMTVFSSTYFSVISTVLFIYIPRCKYE